MKFAKVLYYRFSYNKSLMEGTVNRTDDFLFLSADFFPNEHYRSKRHGNSANNTIEAKTTTVMIKEMHNILSEGRLRLCKSTNEACQTGPPGPGGEEGRPRTKREERISWKQGRQRYCGVTGEKWTCGTKR